jgi:hypothetical protein
MDRTMAATETALAVTLLPHFIADTSLGTTTWTSQLSTWDTTHAPLQELHEDTATLWWQEIEAAADVDKLTTSDDSGCLADLKETWTDAEKNLNVRRKGSRDQSWSPSRAAMSMACRSTNAITDPAVRMNSTHYGVFFSMVNSFWSTFQSCQAPLFRQYPSHVRKHSTTRTGLVSWHCCYHSHWVAKKPTALSCRGLLAY